ncbi:RNA polymerase sigma factor [Sphingobacterium oryzagri]|uniref:RNA polymerase sigma factor n=1 Tax=Sphingobacterium oryzagri TaxID=3025669 RepID=A0ABY7WB80_9SPHI|nr:RNA polymerase sigma factor [Sphingobacterium sp. KACC 22765]WDF66922.1 RNA polymerase sigma factor [Sphingobacterium sp. KACC 22765]
MKSNMTNAQLSSIIQANQPILQGLAYKFTKNWEEVQELVQETMTSSLKFEQNYDNNPRLVAWLYVIMKNVYINGYRKRLKQIRYEQDRVSGFKSEGCTEPHVQNTADHSFLKKDVKKLLSKYPDCYYALFTSYTQGYKCRELAEMYTLPEGTVKTRIHHMRKYLQNKLSGYRTRA